MRTVTLKEIAAWCGGELIGAENGEINSIVSDSRKAGEGALFIAIAGERVDGHRFIPQVIQNGCRAVLSAKKPQEIFAEGLPEECTLILVEDTVKAMGAIGRGYKRSFALKTVGITGSVGKTSCKDMVAAALSGGKRTLKTEGNFNNHIGVPLTLLRLDDSVEAAVIEMGMNHFGEIDYLASLAEPDMGVITNVGTAHIEMLGSREGIRKAKLEMVPHLKTGPLFINGDDDMLKEVKDSLGVCVRTFGFAEDNDARILCSEITEDAQLRVVVTYQGENYDFVLNTMGRHMAYNAAPAIMCAKEMGLTKEEILSGFASCYVPTPHRMTRIRTDRFLILDDTYNANPVSMSAAVDALVEIPGEARRVAVLGDMFELGDYAGEGHYSVGSYVAKCGKVDVLIAVGEEAEAIFKGAIDGGMEEDACIYFPDKDALLKNLLSILKDNDIILLKASHGMAFSDIPEYLGE